MKEVNVVLNSINVESGYYVSITPEDVTNELLKRDDFITTITSYLKEKLQADIVNILNSISFDKGTCYKVSVYLEKYTATPIAEGL